jgi:hypothetical protein
MSWLAPATRVDGMDASLSREAPALDYVASEARFDKEVLLSIRPLDNAS